MLITKRSCYFVLRVKQTNYDNVRNIITLNIPCPLTVEHLLHGHDHLTFDQNKTLFLKVQQFLLALKRFSN